MAKTQAWIAEMLDTHGETCVFWPFSRNTWGYGHLRCNKVDWLAHRYICALVHGDAPFAGALALHSCGNGHIGCVNPKHLRWGTAKENTADAIKAGNLGAGETNANSKLTEAYVKHMRRLHAEGAPFRSIAAQFGVADRTAANAITGKSWAHVQ